LITWICLALPKCEAYDRRIDESLGFGRRALNDKALGTLEYDKVLARLAGLTSFSASRERALALRPSPDYAEVVRRQRLTAEARRMRRLKPNLGLGGTGDIRPAIQKAALGGLLETSELLEIHDTLAAVRFLRGNLTRLSLQLPLLAELAKAMEDLGDLMAEIATCVSRGGDIVDSASPALGAIRSQVRFAHDRLTRKLQDVLATAVARGIAQEPIVTLRDGRYVIPIKADFRGQLRGIVHDVSSSGATAFIEPLSAVELGNAWREAQLEETREVERILRRLSFLVGEDESALVTNVAVLAEIDLHLAKARLGDQMRADDLPQDGADQNWLVRGPAELNLVEARHPLLTQDPVPISLRVGGAFHVLLITGPNTGGKTVALKTAGLLTLMAQAGLSIPALEGTRMPVFKDVYADIGDEQSIEQSLSTFSSHMRTIISILGEADSNTLVLLDELGAGTDPAEGAALARAIVEHLLQAGASTIATTHHGELKTFAQSTAGVSNASVEFDPYTLSPTYRLVIGLPGRSNALAIARRLGMPEEIVARAREEIAPEQLQIEALLSQIQQERDDLAASARAERAAAREAEEIRRELARRLDLVENEREALLDQARADAEDELREARLKLRESIRSIEAAERTRADIPTVNEAMTAVEQGVTRLERRRPRQRRPPPRPSTQIRSQDILPGDRIWVRGLPQAGEVIGLPDERDEVEIRLGSLRTRVKVDQLERVERDSGSQRVTISLAPRGLGEGASVAGQLEVRGQRVDEAVPRVEEYLETAYEAGIPQVRIVHGKGTGTLRRVVRERLGSSPIVASFETAEPSAGGEGVTVVHLAV
jgi:DNA mismatch repair protein MutS2